MYPHFTIGPLPFTGETFLVSTYLLIRAVYLVLAPWLAVRLTAPLGIAKRDVLLLFLIGIPIGIVGAHFLAIAESGGYAPRDVGRLDPWYGRSAIFGGIVAGTAVAAVYCAARGISLPRLLDGCAPVIALGEAVTRVGCFLTGCCFGKPTSSFLGVRFPRGTPVFGTQAWEGLITDPHATSTVPVHPTQLYAAVFAFVLTAFLLYVLRRRPGFDGRVFCLCIASYAAWRFVLAYWRADSGDPLLVGLYASQVWSLAMLAGAVALAWYWRGATVGRARVVRPAASTLRP